MVIVKKLCRNETIILEQHYKKASSRLIRERVHAILLSNEQRSLKDIAKILRRTYKTIRLWIISFNKERLASIFPDYEGNSNASPLTPEQREEIKQIGQRPPSEYGIPKEFWTVESLKTYVQAKFDIVYETDRSYHFGLKLSNLSFKLPSTFDIRRDDAFIEQRMQEIREEISPVLTDEQWIVVPSDETRIVWESEIRRAWLRKGEKTILKVHRDNQYQNFIGFLNLKTGISHLYSLTWQNQEQIIYAGQQLKEQYPDKRICIIWDNAKWHKGALIREQLAAGGSLSSIHLINFPPYAPDKNPQEHVWKYAKDKIANESYSSFETVIHEFKRAVTSSKHNYHI